MYPCPSSSRTYRPCDPGALEANPLRSQLFCHVRKSKFKPALASFQTMIIIGAGTGIAPFRDFLQHRIRLAQVGKAVGKMVLFFGCRDHAYHLYQDELEQAEILLAGQLEVIVAYSRMISAQNCYVQDKIRERQDQVVDLIMDTRARVYVCGSTKMAKHVKATIGQMLRHSQGWSEERLAEFETMQTASKQWQEDVWA